MASVIRRLDDLAADGPERREFVEEMFRTFGPGARKQWVQTTKRFLRCREIKGNRSRAEAAAISAFAIILEASR
jgi:hypothetical protein